MSTSDTLDEKSFRDLAGAVIDRVRAAVDAEDPGVCEAVLEAGVLKIQFPSGQAWVLNLQPPIRELWLAADRAAWHFRWDGAVWVDKKHGGELEATLRELFSKKIGKPLSL
jgi:CyaY protein